MKLIVAVMMITMTLGCGGETAPEKQGATPVTEEDSAEESATELPNVVIARVPLDDNGNEMLDEVSTRLATVDASSFNNEKAETVYETSNDSVVVMNELDEDTSSQSYYYGGRRAAYYWNTPWYPGKLLGRGAFWGRNPYVSYGRRNYGYNYYGNYNSYRSNRNYRYYSYSRW